MALSGCLANIRFVCNKHNIFPNININSNLDPDIFGYNIFDEPDADALIEAPSKCNELTATVLKSTVEKCDSNSNIMLTPTPTAQQQPSIRSTTSKTTVKEVYKQLSTCTVVLNSIDSIARNATTTTSKGPSSRLIKSPKLILQKPATIEDNSSDDNVDDDDGTGDLFEIEESEAPHVPLYLLRDEGAVKWALVNDLCYLLKLKSKDSLLKQVQCSEG